MQTDASVGSGVPVQREEIDGGTRIVADLGPGVKDASVEVLDDVALVVIEDGPTHSQFELDLPEDGSADTFITNGVLTIEVIEA